MPRPPCAPPPMRSPAMRSAPWCWRSGARRVSSILSPAENSHWPRKPPASPRCCCGWRRSRRLRPRKRDGSCARRIRRPVVHGVHGARRCSTHTSFATVMARSGGGSWNGNVMSAFSENRRRILSLWLPRLPIDRIKRQRAASDVSRVELVNEPCEVSTLAGLSPPLRGRVGERGTTDAGARGLPLSLTLPRKGGGNPSAGVSLTENIKSGDFPNVVVAKEHNALLLYAIDEAAARAGLSIGLPLANARAICPELTVHDADEAADRKTLEDIADWCDRFTPLVALDPPHGLFLDITGCAHLFGGEAALLRQLTGALTRQGFAVSAAIAATSICARTLTRCAPGTIVADGEEADAVAPLPVFALGADDAITSGLRRAGLKTIGDVASRARHEITARFGARFTNLLEQALGEGNERISARKLLPDYIVEKRFAEPIATEALIAMTLAGLAGMLVKAMD